MAWVVYGSGLCGLLGNNGTFNTGRGLIKKGFMEDVMKILYI